MAKDNRIKIFTFVCSCGNTQEMQGEEIVYPHIICSKCMGEMIPLTTARYEIPN